MTGRVIARSSYSCWQAAKQKSKKTENQPSYGSSNAVFLAVACAVITGGAYLFTVNSSATKGLEIRQIEKSIGELKRSNEELRLREVELKSLNYIENQTREVNMQDLKNVSYVEESGPLALK